MNPDDNFGDSESAADPDTTALTDVIFLLLIFFLLTFSFGEVSADLPAAVTSEDRLLSPLLISIRPSDNNSWDYAVGDQQALPRGALATALLEELSGAVREAVVIETAAGCPWEEVEYAVRTVMSFQPNMAIELAVQKAPR